MKIIIGLGVFQSMGGAVAEIPGMNDKIAVLFFGPALQKL